MSIKRGTKVEFVGRLSCPGTKHYIEKYGVQVGDKGTVVRAKNGWWRVSFTRQDGSRAVSVPMRYDDIKKRKQDDDVEDVEDELVKRLKHLTTEDTSAFVAGFGNLNAQQLQALDRLGCRRIAAQLQGSCSTTNAEPVQPPMNENFGFDEQPTPDAVVADMKKEAEKMLESQKLVSREHQVCARLLKAEREENKRLNLELAHYSVSMTDLIAELDKIKLRLTASRTLMQLKDKTIAQLRGEPSYDTWGDWIVPEVGSG